MLIDYLLNALKERESSKLIILHARISTSTQLPSLSYVGADEQTHYPLPDIPYVIGAAC